MRIRSLLLSAVILLLFSIPGFAQGVGANCDISGTWYGGSDPKFQYLWTIAPAAGGRYTSVIQPAFDNRQFGYTTWSMWSGEAVKIDARTYDGYAMSYFVWDPVAAAAFNVDPTLPEVDIVRGRMRLVDCNTLTNSIDIYAGYFSFTPEKIPFVTPTDVNWMQPGVTVLVETYHRMPTVMPKSPLVP